MFDVLIVGGGPAGMTASIYAARSNATVAMIEGGAPGGQMVNTAFIENYPGFPKIDGPDLSYAMFQQVIELGVEYIGADALEIKKENEVFSVTCNDGKTYQGKTLIIATGTRHSKLYIPGEKKFSGRGISWCAICDGNFFKGKDVAVIGGGNSALEEAIYLSSLVNKVYLIHRRSEFRGDATVASRIRKITNIELVLESQAVEFVGTDSLEKVKVKNLKTEKETEILVSGCFEYVGQIPSTDLLKNFPVLDEAGYIVTNKNLETNVSKLFAAGDVVSKNIRQITTACNDGTIAALHAVKYVK